MVQGVKTTGNIQKTCLVQQGHSKYEDKLLVSWLLFILSVVRSRFGGAVGRKATEGE